MTYNGSFIPHACYSFHETIIPQYEQGASLTKGGVKFPYTTVFPPPTFKELHKGVLIVKGISKEVITRSKDAKQHEETDLDCLAELIGSLIQRVFRNELLKACKRSGWEIAILKQDQVIQLNLAGRAIVLRGPIFSENQERNELYQIALEALNKSFSSAITIYNSPPTGFLL